MPYADPQSPEAKANHQLCNRNYKAKNPWHVRVHNLSIERYEAMKALGCAICQKPFDEKNPPQVDHDHRCCRGEGSCGQCIRGLLCSACNRGLSALRDSKQNLLAAIRYLDKANDRRPPIDFEL